MSKLHVLTAVQTTASIAVLSLSLSAPAVAGNLSGELTLTSDYMFRGISQTNEGPALQGGITLSQENGAYVAFWGSNVNFGGSLELDIMLGWAGELQPGWALDVGIMQYRYPKSNNSENKFNFFEGYAALSYADATLGVAYSPDYFGAGVKQYWYWYVSYQYELLPELSVEAQLGYNRFSNNEQYNVFLAASPVSGQGYADYRIGLTTTLLQTSWSLMYVGSTVASQADCSLCDDRVVLSLQWAF